MAILFTIFNLGITFVGGDRSTEVYGGQFDPRSDTSLQARGGNGRAMNAAGMRGGGPSTNRPGDWCCQSCGRINFAGRDQCKPCGVCEITLF